MKDKLHTTGKFAGWTDITGRLGIQTFGRNVLMREVGKDLYVKFGLMDGVQVCALTTDMKVVAITETRREIDETYCHLVGGRVDESDKSPREAALRELREETGYVPGALLHMATTKKEPGDCIGSQYHFLALKCEKAGEPERGVVVRLMTYPEFEASLYDYLMRDPERASGGANSLITIALARRWMKQQT